MKYIFRTLFTVALLCGCSSLAKADADFRMTVLDPPNECVPSDTKCFLDTPGAQFGVALSAATCPQGLSGGLPANDFGCFIGDNLTGATITSLTLTFSAPIQGQTASCDSDGQGGIPSALGVVSCTEDSEIYTLIFAGGAGIPPFSDIIVFEEGADPSNFLNGTGVVGTTPEPDSLLLFSTGAMMAGMYMTRKMWVTRKSVGSKL
jgi:hypothetical protein